MTSRQSSSSSHTSSQMDNQSGSVGAKQLVVPGSAQAIDQMKNEIAQEFGVQLGPDESARANGSVGGEITKRLVTMAQQQLNQPR